MDENKNKQLVVCIGREHGSMGHEIARKLADKRGISLYDKEILQDLSKEYNIDEEYMEKYDEKPKNPIISRVTNSISGSLEDVIAEKVFRYQRQLMRSGESFVVVGRCSDYILKDYNNAVKIFIYGDEAKRIENIKNKNGCSERTAKREMLNVDKARKFYHDHYSNTRWGDPVAYDLMIDSTATGIDGAVEIVSRYLDYLLGE